MASFGPRTSCLNPVAQGSRVTTAPGTVDALPSLRLRKRQRDKVLRRVRRTAETQVLRLRLQNAPGIKFCGECGKPLGGAGETRSLTGPSLLHPEAPRREDPHLPSALEGERKQVTVLFADVKGSMDLAEQLDPEEWHKILDGFFRILTDGVHRFEGTVNQYTGDGIMALFGAPIAHEDHAQRACLRRAPPARCASRLCGRAAAHPRVSFAARMGLNSGEVVVGRIGDDLRMDYTAQGHTVGLAQRMEQLAEPDSAYLTAHTARLVEGYFALRSLGEFALKGVARAGRRLRARGLGFAAHSL